MSYLEEHEWMLLNEISFNISYIYDFGEMKKNILVWLSKLIPYEGALLSELHINNKGTVRLKQPTFSGISEKSIDVLDKQHFELEDTNWRIMSSRNNAYVENEAFSSKAWEERTIYNNYYLPNMLYYSMAMVITFKEEPVGLIKLYRKKMSAPFTTRDTFALDMLQKHFAYRFSYEAKKGDSRYFYAKGYMDRICGKYNFTEREREVFIQAIQGYSNEEIADNMNVSIHTIKKHLQNMYGKMGINNRVQLLQGLPLSTSKIDLDNL